MKKCVKCRRLYDDTWQICLHCDSPLVEATLTKEEEENFKKRIQKKEEETKISEIEAAVLSEGAFFLLFLMGWSFYWLYDPSKAKSQFLPYLIVYIVWRAYYIEKKKSARREALRKIFVWLTRQDVLIRLFFIAGILFFITATLQTCGRGY